VAKQVKAASAAAAFRSGDLLARSIFVSLFSALDAFTGDLLKAVYTARPETLHSIERSIQFKDVVTMTSPEELRGYILDTEIEQLRRDSYVEQFRQIEKRFGIATLREFAAWAEFVEKAQRRNLVVHGDGRVSRQYLQVCKSEGYVFDPEPKLGETLGVSDEYLDRSIDLLFEVGVKLGQTLWRVVLPDDLEAAESDVIERELDLLHGERWSLAKTIGEFAFKQRKFSSERTRLVTLINFAQALKWQGERDAARAVLEKQDWSSATADFDLAVAVLSDRFDDAAELMKRAVTGEKIEREEFHAWPLFREFRKSKQFLKTYRSIFGRDFADAERERAQAYARTIVSDAKRDTSSESSGEARARDQQESAVPPSGETTRRQADSKRRRK
jgi:hypothetical protein